MPTCDMTVSSQSVSVSAETVTFADGAAGATQKLKLDYDKVLSEYGDRIGKLGDTSLSFATGTVLTTEVEWKFKNGGDADTDTKRLATMSSGEYMVDYENGYILGKNATITAVSTDAASYKIRKHDIIDVTLEVGDIEIGAVELKSGTSDNRALVSAAGEASVLDTNSAAALVQLTAINTNIDALEADLNKITDTSYIDNQGWTDGSSKHLLVGGLYQSTLQTVTDGKVAPFQVSVNGILLTMETPTTSAAAAPSITRDTSVDEVAAIAIKASAGNMYGYSFDNPNGYDVFVKWYNTAHGSVTVGTTSVVRTTRVPAVGSVFVEANKPQQNFTTAIAIACTKLIADGDTTAITTDIYAEVYYK